MAKLSKVRRNSVSRRVPSCHLKVLGNRKKCTVRVEKKDNMVKKEWEDGICSVCLEYPHNAVLLLCSSYHKGCRPYMCATSYRYSNCLEQYKKAYTKVGSTQSAQPWLDSMDGLTYSFADGSSKEKMEATELLCPLCRGQVKGWTVVDDARKYLNSKKRTCMHDSCAFLGTYKEIRKHVKKEHPMARPRDVDPMLEEKWKRLEGERERQDIMSTITSTTPGAVVVGDYVIEDGFRGFFSDFGLDGFFNEAAFHVDMSGSHRNRNIHLYRGIPRRHFHIGESLPRPRNRTMHIAARRQARRSRDRESRRLRDGVD